MTSPTTPTSDSTPGNDPATEVSETSESPNLSEHQSQDTLANIPEIPAEETPSENVTEPLSDLEKLQKAVTGTSYKDLPALLSLQKRLLRLKEETAPAAPAEIPAEAPEEFQIKAPSEPTDDTGSSAAQMATATNAETDNGKAAEAGNTDEAVAAGDADKADDKISDQIPDPSEDISARQTSIVSLRPELSTLEERLTLLLDQHQAWQQKLITDIEQSVSVISTKISDGQISEAQSLWDRSNNALKRIDNTDVQQQLQLLLAPHKAELNKLLEWKKFAASEKKKELIEKMQTLGNDQTAPAQKSKLIRALQDEWKLLGHSDDNDALWIQFTDVARVAFEPCKIYFKERKENQAGNLIARNNICEQLEAYAATMQEDSINLSEVSRLENQAREDWKKYAPVAQNKIKNLQKRFNAVLAELRQKKRTALQIHNDQKQALIEQAKKLLELEDLQAAIQQAKQLQQDWKTLGPGSFKEDRKLWGDFRAACDALFARRDEISRESKQQLRHASTEVRDILRRINALLSLDDEAFSESRGQFNALGQEFHKALTPDLKAERKALQDQFQKLSKRFDARLRATPDKKVLQLLQQVQLKAEFCQRHEDALLTGDATMTRETAEEEWQNLARISDEDAEQAMKKRFRQLLQLLEDASDCLALADKQELRARELCVDAEIMAGVETPAADKAIRMQQQLNHLQRGLGRLPVTQKERLQKMLETDMQFLCLGPLKPLVRSTLANRLQQIRQKL